MPCELRYDRLSHSIPHDISRNFPIKIQELFFIVSGTVAVYTDGGDEVAHLCDGNLFGEMAFLLFDENFVRICS